MESLVRIGHRVIHLEQTGSQELSRVSVAAMGEQVINVFAPYVEDLAPIGLKPPLVVWPGFELVTDVDAERRHEILVEVLVLIVSPDQDEVWGKRVDLLSDLP